MATWQGIELLVVAQVLSNSLGWSMSISELVRKTGLSRKTVAQSLNVLVSRGRVKARDGRYRSVNDGDLGGA